MKHKFNTRASYWRDQIRLAAVHADGVRDYCEKNGIQRQAFYYWKKRLKGRGPLRRGASQPFAEVEVVEPSQERARRGGELPDPRWLAEFVLALGSGR